MTKYTVTKEQVLDSNANVKEQKTELPKYVSPILNQVNNWARATRPETVGKLATEIFPDFMSNEPIASLEKWKEYYLKNHTDKYIAAKEKLKCKFEEVKAVINSVDDSDINTWIDNLIFFDTYAGLYVQDVVLNDLATKLSFKLIKPTAKQEGQNIDGFINDVPYSVKPLSYKDSPLSKIDKIKATMIYYEKVGDEIIYYVEE